MLAHVALPALLQECDVYSLRTQQCSRGIASDSVKVYIWRHHIWGQPVCLTAI